MRLLRENALRLLAGGLMLMACAPCARAQLAAPDGAYLAPAPRLEGQGPLALAEPGDSIVVIYNHGSKQEFRRDSCAARGGAKPGVIADLAGATLASKRVAVFVYCTPSKTGTFDHRSGRGEPKIERRSKEIADLAEAYAAAGVPRRQIFLAGQSAGGWASLLAVGRSAETPEIGGVIAFAPAFAGRRADRSPGWQMLRDRLARELAGFAYLPALVYAFEGDSLERPEDLAFLSRVPGVEFRKTGVRRIGGRDCKSKFPHFLAFDPCFRATQASALLSFIKARVGTGPAS